jgi:hypothetical protein
VRAPEETDPEVPVCQADPLSVTEQDEALWEDQVMVVDWPEETEVGTPDKIILTPVELVAVVDELTPTVTGAWLKVAEIVLFADPPLNVYELRPGEIQTSLVELA